MNQYSKSFYFIIICFIIPVLLKAQLIDSNKLSLHGNTFIEKIDNLLSFKISINDDIKGFIVKNTSTYEILPNDKNVLKISTNYRWLSGSLSLTPKFFPGNNDNTFKGETKAISFALNLNFDHWNQNFSYSKVKGYYLKNTADFDPSWISGVDPYVQFPDLVYNGFYGHTAYKFNKKFSFAALSAQTERQLKSSGTFMPLLSYNYYIIDDKTPLTGLNSSQKSNNLELMIAIGYYYTFVIQKYFYISAGLQPGGGIITTKLLTRLPSGDIITRYTNAIYRLEGGLALGYNGKKFFAGTQFIASGARYNQSNTSNVIVSDRLTYQVFAGYRFKAPKILEKTVNKIDDKRAALFRKSKK